MSLYERVERLRTGIHLSEETCRLKLDSWREQIAGGDDELFSRRLRAEGLHQNELPAIIGGAVCTTLELPEWCLFLKEALASISETTDVNTFGDPGQTGDLPFYSLTRPFLQAAERRLVALVSGCQVLDDSTVAQSVNYLARSLCTKAASAYHLEFVLFRA